MFCTSLPVIVCHLIAMTATFRSPKSVFTNLLHLLGKNVSHPIVVAYKERYPYYDIQPHPTRHTVVFKISEWVTHCNSLPKVSHSLQLTSQSESLIATHDPKWVTHCNSRPKVRYSLQLITQCEGLIATHFPKWVTHCNSIPTVIDSLQLSSQSEWLTATHFPKWVTNCNSLPTVTNSHISTHLSQWDLFLLSSWIESLTHFYQSDKNNG